MKGSESRYEQLSTIGKRLRQLARELDTEVIVAKQRNGPTGEVTLNFLKQFMRFENHIPEPSPNFV